MYINLLLAVLILVLLLEISMTICNLILISENRKLKNKLKRITKETKLDPDLEYMINNNFYRLLPSNTNEELVKACLNIVEEYRSKNIIKFKEIKGAK